MPWSVKFVRSLTWLKKDLSFHFRMDSHQGNLLKGIVNLSVKVEKIYEDSFGFDPITFTFSENSNYLRESLFEVIRQNIAIATVNKLFFS